MARPPSRLTPGFLQPATAPSAVRGRAKLLPNAAGRSDERPRAGGAARVDQGTTFAPIAPSRPPTYHRCGQHQRTLQAYYLRRERQSATVAGVTPCRREPCRALGDMPSPWFHLLLLCLHVPFRPRRGGSRSAPRWFGERGVLRPDARSRSLFSEVTCPAGGVAAGLGAVGAAKYRHQPSLQGSRLNLPSPRLLQRFPPCDMTWLNSPGEYLFPKSICATLLPRDGGGRRESLHGTGTGRAAGSMRTGSRAGDRIRPRKALPGRATCDKAVRSGGEHR